MLMLYYEGLTCPVCDKSFNDGDDIVVCPHCGLPHHRNCWIVEGQCHDAANHGTENQWSREKAMPKNIPEPTSTEEQPTKAQVCTHCNTKNPEFAEFCAHCGASLKETEWYTAAPREHVYTPFVANTHNPQTEEEKALAAIVGQNTQYYIPRFRNILNNQYGGWNWAAFLLGPYWLVYRKQYSLGALMFIFQTILSVASILFPMPTTNSVMVTPEEAEAMMTQIMANPMLLATMLLSVLLLVARILLGIKGNDLYLNHCNRRIEKARQHADDLSAAELSSFGGVSVGVTIMFGFISMMIETIVIYFLM